ncbi:MAG: FAD:protein FMN transferase [Planctomycetes bacterium]|nr:FAD:protein FMN transferase [Planctomycetota bacterium]
MHVKFLAAALLSVFAVACGTPRRFEFEERAMGTLFRVVVHAESAEAAQRGASAAFARIHELDQRMSDYLESSELSNVSASAGSGRACALSEDLWRVLALAQSFSEASAGAFDVTAGPLIDLWRRARRQGELPSATRLELALARVGWRALELDPVAHTATLARGGMKLDLGGIAKGYAVDAALDVLAEHGLESALVVGGGDVGVRAAPPGEQGWAILIAPFEDAGQRVVLELAHAAVSTSGDSMQALVLDGKRYSHIVDPRTGQALAARISATVVAADSTTADALATTLCVLGDASGLAWAQRVGARAARIVRESENGRESSSTPSFDQLILHAPRPRTLERASNP